MYSELYKRELQPVSEMPIWARLQLATMIPETYFWDEGCNSPRSIKDVVVQGFTRMDDTIWIFYTIPWEDGYWSAYMWDANKNEHGGEWGRL